MIKMEHWNGDLGWPSTVVSDQSRARSPSLPFQFPIQCLARREHLFKIVECMNHLLEAFHMWREQKFLEGLGQWITMGKVWLGLLNLIDFSVGQSHRSACCHPWSLRVCVEAWTEHEQQHAGVGEHSFIFYSLLLSLELEAHCVPLVMS